MPGKNIRRLANKPLIAYAIEAGLQTGLFKKLIVSTDSPEIATIAREYGAETPFMRPAELGADDSPEILSWQHAVSWCRRHGVDFDTFVSIPTTSPLRDPEDIIKCVKTFEAGDFDLLITCQEAHCHPMFNMYKRKAGDLFTVYDLQNPPVTRRQNAPAVFDGAAIAYVSRPDYILGSKSLWDGKVTALSFPREKAVDIDDELDFQIAEFLMRKKLGQA